MYTTQHTDGTHLSQEDRAIAQVIHKNYSTVCRELLRNTERDGAYNAERAQKKCRVRRNWNWELGISPNKPHFVWHNIPHAPHEPYRYR